MDTMFYKRTPSVSSIYRDQTILVTGGNGFVGSVLLYRLLHGPIKPKRVFALIRGEASKLPCFLRPFLGSALRTVNGDCNLPNLGLSKETFDELFNYVDIVFHCAADTRFNRTLHESITINVTMAQNLCAFSTAAPNVKTHVHASSAFVNGWLDSGMTSFESLEQTSFHVHEAQANAYSHAKSIAEGIASAYVRAGTKVAFVNLRLSSIAPAFAYPHPAYGSLLRAAPLCAAVAAEHFKPGDLPPDATWDTLPVDIAVDQMISLAASIHHYAEPSTLTTYHVVAGPGRALPVSLFLEPSHHAARPKVKREAFLRAYMGTLEKTISFSNARALAVLGLRDKCNEWTRLTPEYEEQQGGPVDTKALTVDLDAGLEKIGGWPAYLRLVKNEMGRAFFFKQSFL